MSVPPPPGDPVGLSRRGRSRIAAGRVLGVDRASAATGASVPQWSDSGTPDHLRRLR